MKQCNYSREALFQLNGIPPLGMSISLALQHLVAMIVGCVTPVSYTHLDVYKRQVMEWNGTVIADLSRDFLNTNGAVKHAGVRVAEKDRTELATPRFQSLRELSLIHIWCWSPAPTVWAPSCVWLSC